MADVRAAAAPADSTARADLNAPPDLNASADLGVPAHLNASADLGPPADLTAPVVGLVRTARAAGLLADTTRELALVGALDRLDVTNRSQVYWAGRLTLCASRDDIDRYDRVFDAYLAGRQVGRRPVWRPAPALTVLSAADAGQPPDAGGPADGEPAAAVVAAASDVEVLRRRDLARLTAAERDVVRRLLAALRLPGESRRSRRFRPAGRTGWIDPRRTARAALSTGGEAIRLHRRRHRTRPRRVVLLVDVSGSMNPYAEALLRFAHAACRAAPGRLEVFTVGTRLTRVTRELSTRDADAALSAAGGSVPDWSGGTRLGAMLAEFLREHGRRGLARGAVVVVLSDGWERGDAALLGEQMAMLHRLAHRVVWANPRKHQPGYAPLAAGMAAALPHVDAFVEGHSLAALEHLAAVVAGRA